MLKLFDTYQTSLSFHIKLKKTDYSKSWQYYVIFIQSMGKNSFVLTESNSQMSMIVIKNFLSSHLTNLRPKMVYNPKQPKAYPSKFSCL